MTPGVTYMRQSDMRGLENNKTSAQGPSFRQAKFSLPAIMHLLKTIHIAHQIPLFALALAVTLPARKHAQLLNILPPPSNLTPLHNAQILTALLHSNLTLPQANQTISTPNHLPADPFFAETVTGSSVKFFNYGASLTAGDGFAAIVEAQRDCITHMQPPNNPNARIRGPLRIYSAGTVILRLMPLMVMTWAMWSAAVVVVLLFVDGYEFVELTFDVLDPDLGYLASGSLRLV
ncbi:hypothetical protein OEA41_004750 [Lepraria neglecta]|uniref:Uncharacterized protein n=1 Tax=Lepraria neglecta TaxID=209136 RepID=A0AAD9Z0K6_9LECA|nr:hypothetical protein OEA41_004750 [Lepraria neglecta]